MRQPLPVLLHLPAPEGHAPRACTLKDDDYRLSFLYGNFTTLTRFTEADLERVVTERLSPLYVSIHATDPDVRTRLLRNRRGATSLRWLAALLDAGIEVHGQVVVCPGINDGAVLDDTLLGVLDRFPALATVGVVPLGVSDHTTEPEMRPHTTAEADAVLDTSHAGRRASEPALGRRLVFAADEYYLLAGRPFPELDAYDGCPQHENGIGMARTFEDEVQAALAGDELVADGDARRVLRLGRRRARRAGTARHAPARRRRPPPATRRDASGITILTGEYGARVLAPLLPSLDAVAAVPRPPRAGPEPLLRRQHRRHRAAHRAPTSPRRSSTVPADERYLLPDVVLSEGRFLDG